MSMNNNQQVEEIAIFFASRAPQAKALKKKLRRNLRNQSSYDVEDLLQEGYLRLIDPENSEILTNIACRNGDSFEVASRKYFSKSAVNRSINIAKRESRLTSRDQLIASGSQRLHKATNRFHEAVDEIVTYRLLIEKAVKMLPPSKRRLFYYTHLSSLNDREIAVTLDIKRNSVKSMRSRMLAEMAEKNKDLFEHVPTKKAKAKNKASNGPGLFDLKGSDYLKVIKRTSASIP